MKSNKDELKKYLKRSSIEYNNDNKEIGLELETNFEALQEGRFPDKILEEIKTSDNFGSKEIMKEIEKKHAEILDKRPIPELLESANLIDTLQELKPPAMGKLYDEKKNTKGKQKSKFLTEE